ncbi:hypothetical protein HQ533_00785 [Candidatus Woesearchaeota archaeon]|nr:hypothetical protein [Candidatus Woesearchaeota archaeon]
MLSIIKIIIILIALYIFIISFLSRIFIPNLHFWRSPIPDRIPMSMQEEINRIKKKSKTKHDFLKNTFAFLTSKYKGEKVKTYSKLYLLWKPLDYIWRKKGFLHCCRQNHLMRIFLIKSGMFTEEDIRLKHITLCINIHQYIEVRTEKGWIPVDTWTHAFGTKFGEKPPLWI